MHGGDESLQQAPVVFRIRQRIPVIDILLVPQRVIADAAAEMSHHELHVLHECRNLCGRLGRPEDGIEAAVGIVEAARRGHDGIRQFAGGRSVHRIPVQQLHLNLDAVIHQRVDVIVQAGRESPARRASARSNPNWCSRSCFRIGRCGSSLRRRRTCGSTSGGPRADRDRAGRSELMPKPSWIWEERLGGTRFWAEKGQDGEAENAGRAQDGKAIGHGGSPFPRRDEFEARG